MADIFISYAREDREWVEKLANAFQEEGYTVWWDWDLLVGKRYRETIETELQTCKATLVVWSEQSIKSDFVRDEAEEGQQRNILVPILKQAVRPPAGFRQLQTADLANWNGDVNHAEFRRMLKGLSHLIGREAKSMGAADAHHEQAVAAAGAAAAGAAAAASAAAVTAEPAIARAPATPTPQPAPVSPPKPGVVDASKPVTAGPSMGTSPPPSNAPTHAAGFAAMVPPASGAAASGGSVPGSISPTMWRNIGIGVGVLVLIAIALALVGGGSEKHVGPKPSSTPNASAPHGVVTPPAQVPVQGTSTVGDGETTTTRSRGGAGSSGASTPAPSGEPAGGGGTPAERSEGRHHAGGTNNAMPEQYTPDQSMQSTGSSRSR